MRSLFRLSQHKSVLLFSTLFLVGWTSSQAAKTIFVKVVDANGTLLPGATVYAASFGNHGPDATKSAVMADGNDGDGTSNGYVQLSLTDNTPFEIFADLQNYGPTVNNQMYNPNHPHVFTDASVDGTTVTITLNQTFTDRGAIRAHIVNATHNSGIFGNVRKVSTGNDIAFGACVTNGGGVCDMILHNIPATNTLNTYDVSAFDPAGNNGSGQGNGGQLSKVVTVVPPDTNVAVSTIDISGGLPPDLSANSGGSNNPGQPSNGGLQGVVEEVGVSSMTIPWGGLNLRVFDSNGNRVDRQGTGVDQNGRFQFFGLDVGTTYYVRAFGGCRQDGVCYDGYESTGTPTDAHAGMGRNDFLYISSDPVTIQVSTKPSTDSFLHVTLKRSTPGQFSIPVYVRDDTGRLLPGSGVNLFPDGTPWHHSANPHAPYAGGAICDGLPHAVDISSPAFANLNVQAATGYALLSGLKPGNYSVGAWTQFGNNQQLVFNAGPDGVWNWGPQSGGNNHRGCFQGSQDDLRLTIEDTGVINIYDTSGTIVMANVSSITIVSPVPTGLTAVASGTLTFPGIVDLSNEPISIVLNACDQNGCHGNFTSINGSGQSSYPYSINVASADAGGKALTYWIQVVSQYWGVVQEGDGQNQFSFAGSTTAVKNFKFERAGRAIGKLYKPDGSLFQPGQQAGGGYLSANVNAQGISNHSWGNAQVNQDGSFVIGGLLPGEYALIPQTYGSVSYAPKEPAEHIIVTALADSYKDVKFIDGQMVQVGMNIASVPALNTTYDQEGIHGEYWEARRLPAGSIFSQELLTKILNHDGQDSSTFDYAPASSTVCNGGPALHAGFCVQTAPSNATYDFHMLRTANIDGHTGDANYAYFTIVGSSKNVIVDADHLTPPSAYVNGSTVTTLVHVNFNPTITEGAMVTGQVTATHFLRQVDFNSFGGNFNNFMKYIPIVTVYDDKGQLVSAGMVTPTPQYISLHNKEFDSDVAHGDWNAFSQLLAGDSWHFGLKGVPPGKTYTLVGTTPNYPPIIKTFTTGVDGSTVTVNIDWDAEVGAGATLKGVVMSTAGVAVAGASVEIQAKAIKPRSLKTDANGNYLTEGLPKGKYKIEVDADGYAPVAQDQDVVADTTYTVNFTQTSGFPLVAAPGVITGTVREISFTSQGPIVRPISGAKIYAYDDTFNGNNPDKPLALYKVITSSDGVYTLKGLIPTDVYKISAFAPGRYVKTISTAATNGVLSGVDLMLNKKGLTVQVFAKPGTVNYEFSILNPNNFDSGRVWYYRGALGTFSTANPAPTEITNSFHDLPDGSLLGSVPLASLTSGVTYVLHIEAVPANGAPLVTKEISFGLDVSNTTDQPVDDKLIGDDTTDDSGNDGNAVKMDSTGQDGTSLQIPAGSLIPTDVVPSIGMSEGDANTVSGQATLGSRATTPSFYGKAVNVNFSDVQFTQRDVILNAPFDPNLVGGNIANLQVLHFVNNQWIPLQGQITVDPVTSVVSISVHGTQIAGQAPLSSSAVRGRSGASMMAAFDGKQHYVNAQSTSSGSGTFVVGLAASTGTVAVGYHQYNFPNPFDLKDKPVNLRSGTGNNVATNIRGTYIVISPTGSGTNEATIRIYDVAGDMVREIKGNATSGIYNYFHWDGRNTAGNDVASGVYFAVVDAPGSDKKTHIKMVVVK